MQVVVRSITSDDRVPPHFSLLQIRKISVLISQMIPSRERYARSISGRCANTQKYASPAE